MNTYIMNQFNGDASNTKKLHYEIVIDDTKDSESEDYSDNAAYGQYDEAMIAAMVEKYLSTKGKVMSEDNESVDESEDSAESEEDSETTPEAESESEVEEKESAEYESSEAESESEMDDNIEDLAVMANELIINGAMESYKDEFGEYPSLDILKKGLSVARAGLFDNLDDESDNEYECETDVEFADELEDALLIASDIGSIHQIYLVHQIMDTFYEINDRESTLDELKIIFGNIKNELQEEAEDEILDLIDICDSDSDDEDDDYFVTKEDIMQGVLDDSIDLEYNSSDVSCEEYLEESEFDNEYESEDDEDDSDYIPEEDTQNYDGDFELYQ